jgi:thiol-disulfide isomerase/thioredoxin
MRMTERAMAALVVSAALLAGFGSLQAAANGPSPLLGQELPNLSGRGTSGRLINLKALQRDVIYLKDAEGKPIKEKGKLKSEVVDYVLVLNFFATYCVPCVKEIPTFNKIAKSYEGRPVRFIYVNVDTEKTPDEVQAFARQKGIAVEMMFPSVSFALKAYQIETLPRIVIADRKGIVRQVIAGFQDDLTAQIDGLVQPLLAAQ